MEDQKILDLFAKLVEDISEIKQTILTTQENESSLSASQQRLEQKIDKLTIHQENVIMPRLDILYEGQTGLISQLKDRAMDETVKELESTVHILVDATKKINQEMKTVKDEIAELKQA